MPVEGAKELKSVVTGLRQDAQGYCCMMNARIGCLASPPPPPPPVAAAGASRSSSRARAAGGGGFAG
jgi:hypothetical protein